MDNEEEIDRILAQADVICESPELLGAVRPSTHDTGVGTEGMAPLEGGNGGVRMGGGDSCHGSPPSLSHLGPILHEKSSPRTSFPRKFCSWKGIKFPGVGPLFHEKSSPRTNSPRKK